MYNDCEICGKGGRRLVAFAGAVWVILCDRHAAEFEAWAEGLRDAAESQTLLDNYGILAVHAQGGKDCKAEMGDLAVRLRDIKRKLWKAARQWVENHAADASRGGPGGIA